MANSRPTWQLVLEGAQRLTTPDQARVKLADLVEYVQRLDSSRGRGSISPVVQGMTANAGVGPAQPCGKVFVRVDHGFYELRDGADAVLVEHRLARAAARRRRARLLSEVEARGRLDGLIRDFDACLNAYNAEPPFKRADQLRYHRRTIERRVGLGSVEAAIHDDEFVELLHATLQQWGIGRRRSKLASLDEFRRLLQGHVAQLIELEPLSLENLSADIGSVVGAIDHLVSTLGVVDNKALVVAGTKTLHHLLPDLVPPMDRAWTGVFFGWSSLDPQNIQSVLLKEALEGFAEVARATHPSRLVGAEWRTSSSKILDNALVGYCMLQGIGGSPS